MKDMKRSWETPQLIILARGTPAETLTTGCKQISILINGPDTTIQDGCARIRPTEDCGACQARDGNVS